MTLKEKLIEQKEKMREYYQAKKQEKEHRDIKAREKRQELKAIEREAYAKAREKYLIEQREKAIKTAEQRGIERAKKSEKGYYLEKVKGYAEKYMSQPKAKSQPVKKVIHVRKSQPVRQPSGFSFDDALGFGSAPKQSKGFEDTLGMGGSGYGGGSNFENMLGFSSAPKHSKTAYRISGKSKTFSSRSRAEAYMKSHKMPKRSIYKRQSTNSGGFDLSNIW